MLLDASSEVWQRSHNRPRWQQIMTLLAAFHVPSAAHAWSKLAADLMGHSNTKSGAGWLIGPFTHLAADVVGQSKTEVLLVSETASPSLADIILGPLKQREAQGSPQQAVGLQAGATDSPVGTLSNASSWGSPTQPSPLGVQGQRQHLQAPVAGSSPGKLGAWYAPAGRGAGRGSLAAVGLGAT